MPTYVYRCGQCAERLELIQKISDPPCTDCPSCGGPISRVIQPVGVAFKGSGFHVNDYPKSDKEFKFRMDD